MRLLCNKFSIYLPVFVSVFNHPDVKLPSKITFDLGSVWLWCYTSLNIQISRSITLSICVDITGPKCLLGSWGYCHTLLRDFTFISTLSLSVINILGMFTDDFSIFLYQNGLCWLIYLNAACAIVYRQGSSWFILMRLWNSTCLRNQIRFVDQFLAHVVHQLDCT